MVLGRRRVPPQPQRPITGSAVRIDKRNSDRVKRTKRDWQARALEMIDLVGEAHYASDFFGDGLAKLVLYIQREEQPGQWQDLRAAEDAADPAVVYWRGIRDPAGGTRLIQSQYGRLVSFACGDARLVASWDADRNDLVYELLSVSELDTQSDGRYRRKTSKVGGAGDILREPGGDAAPSNPGEVRVYRFWRQDDEYSGDADAPMRGVLDVLEELHLMTLSVKAVLRSRVSRASILGIPDEFLAGEVTVEPEDEAEDAFTTSPLLSDMTEHFLAPNDEPESAASIVPYILTGPMDALKEVRYIQLYDPQDALPEIALRREAVERFARGVKLPVEIVLGMGAANHWSAWAIDDSTWKAHLQPEAVRMVMDFTEVLLRPALRAMGVQDAERYRVWFDPSELVVNPDRTKDYMQAHRQRAISDQALRLEIGATDDVDVPSPEFPNSATSGGGQPASGADQQQEPDQAASASGLQHARGVAVMRCLEAAGSKILSRLSASERASLANVPTSQLASSLGAERVAALLKAPGGHVRASDLVRGGASCLKEYLAQIGVQDADRFVVEAEAYAASILFDADQRHVA